MASTKIEFEKAFNKISAGSSGCHLEKLLTEAKTAGGIKFNEGLCGATLLQVPAIVDKVYEEHAKRCRFEDGTRETIHAMLQEGVMPDPWVLGAVMERMETWCSDW